MMNQLATNGRADKAAARTPIPPASPWRRVTAISSTHLSKRLRTEDGAWVTVHRFACAGVGDLIRASADGDVVVKTEDGQLPVYPPFVKNVRIPLTRGITLDATVMELATEEQLEAHQRLVGFHYRNKTSFGRRAVLLLEGRNEYFPKYLGFIEITTPFMHSTSRNRVLNAPFSEPARSVRWMAWDLKTRNRYVHVVARISRVVVHPEVRGLGLSTRLINVAEQFCLSRWQVHAIRPLFLEITADMLKFMPFVEKAGFHHVGESEGNINRLAKDISYLARTLEDHGGTYRSHSVLGGTGKGILNRQLRDLRLLTELKQSMAPDRDWDSFLAAIIDNGEISISAWEYLLPIVRFPKPTYMKGLTSSSDAFLGQQVRVANPSPTPRSKQNFPVPCTQSLKIVDLTINLEIDVGGTGQDDRGQIRRAFGLDRRFKQKTGVQSLNLEIHPGQICYFFGSSGAGKTCLLRALRGNSQFAASVQISGQVRMPHEATIETIDEDLGPGALIETIGARSLADAISALNAAGLAEPRIYLSEYSQLSAGQKYRAKLARLICSNANVWLLDEFASDLDDGTAITVARNFSRVARRHQIVCVVASVRRYPVIQALDPDITVALDQLGTHTTNIMATKGTMSGA